jgi:alpha-1,2-rhamnosyltransferase
MPDGTTISLIKIENGGFYSLDTLEPGLNTDKKIEVEVEVEVEAPSLLVFKLWLYNLAKEKRQQIADKLKWKPLNRFLMAPRTELGLLSILYTLSLIGVYKKIRIFIIAVSERLSNDADFSEPLSSSRTSEITFVEGDVILLLDSSFHLPAWRAIGDGKKQGAKFIAVIYDLIPITHSQFCEQTLTNALNSWFEEGKNHLDGYIAISKTVQKTLQDHLISINAQVDPHRLGYFYLGADMEKREGQARPDLKNSLSKHDSYIIVSTIEPRKNHQYLIETFNQLWQENIKINLHIVGWVGWKVESLIQDIKNHPEFNKQLFLWNDLDDGELIYCYKNSKALVFPSYVEGFGLPIIEAQYYKLPVLASDIPVHREVGGDGVIYFDIEDTADLKNKIYEVESGYRSLKNGGLATLEPFKWENSTKMLIQEVQRIITLS